MQYSTGIGGVGGMKHQRVQVKFFKYLWNLIYDKGGFSWDKMTSRLENIDIKAK